jgi:hypothetical protein
VGRRPLQAFQMSLVGRHLGQRIRRFPARFKVDDAKPVKARKLV